MLKLSQPDARRPEREQMVLDQVAARGVHNSAVLAALRAIPREWFVHERELPRAYADEALAADCGQTISQPFMVGYMTAALELKRTHRVLEIGSGTGYQTAVLARIAGHVYTIEWHLPLLLAAAERLAALELLNVIWRCGDGSCGWPERAPFDRILVTAGGPDVPAALVEQLAPDGVLVIPVGGPSEQMLVRLRRTAGRIAREELLGCRFVKLRGAQGWTAG